ncbi:MAG: hypothetical protein QM791_04575 [Ferruginibacter sp.]
MKRCFSFIIALLLCVAGYSQNILLRHDNKPVDYTRVNPEVIRESVDVVMKATDRKVAAIIKSSANQTMGNTFFALDDLLYELADLSSRLQLIYSTFADDSTRSAAFAAADKLQLYSNNLYLNEPLYKAIKKFAQAKASTLTHSQGKFLSDGIIVFEKNGMKLEPAKRKELEELNKKLIALGNQFDRNIAESKDSISFTAAELEGVPAVMQTPWKR